MAEVIDGILIREVETKNIMTKSSLPVGGYSVNPYPRHRCLPHTRSAYTSVLPE